MLDFRHQTFLALCTIGSYTKTAEELNMTQPGVTQHIKYLEQYYGGKLFIYKNRKLSLTKKGEKLYNFTNRVQADRRMFERVIFTETEESVPLLFGATLTIGEYIMPKILRKLIEDYPETSLSMNVGNTEVLLNKLHKGEINFALLEGYFNKAEYESIVMKKERFIPVCSKKSNLVNREVTLKELLTHNLVLREKGSGTRDILEHSLLRYNLTVQSFKHIYEVGNMSAIKQLVAEDAGVSFMYLAAAKKELEEGILSEINVEGFLAEHDFSFVFLKDSIHTNEYLKWYELIKNADE